MIAKLSGLIDSVGADWAVIDVSGVGYLMFCSSRTLSRLPDEGKPASLFVETHVREDHIHLYGFVDPVERDWFRLLTTVQGVGARVALAVLSVLGPDQLLLAIVAQDKGLLSRADGVGAKLAGRIVAELKDQAGGLALGPAAAAGSANGVADTGAGSDAISALVNLGYRQAEAYGAVAQATQRLGSDATVESLIRAGLKELAR
ncbi:MAG: Holliday junction branch migration protein RuvA [Kiloniellales bacterium]